MEKGKTDERIEWLVEVARRAREREQEARELAEAALEVLDEVDRLQSVTQDGGAA